MYEEERTTVSEPRICGLEGELYEDGPTGKGGVLAEGLRWARWARWTRLARRI